MSDAREPAITLKNVGVAYSLRKGLRTSKRFWALEDVSFTIHKGESIGVVGRNGAGKSTLLRLLAGVIGPDRGEFINHGYSVSLLAMNLGFLPYLTGRENAILGGMFQGLTRQEVEERMEEIIEFSELGNFIDQPLSTYSSGMQARLGFAVAFQVKPDVLLVDEVIAVGDQEFQEKSMECMKERMRDSDTTIVFVSHNGHLLKELCERCVWIENRVTREVDVTARVLGLYGQFISGQRATKLPQHAG